MSTYLKIWPFLLFLFCLSALESIAQDSIVFTRHQLSVVKWKADPLPSEINTSKILKEIAYDEVLGLNKTAVRVSFDLICKIIPSGDQSGIHIRIAKTEITGDIRIRGFSIAEKLRPARFSVSLSVVRKADSLILHKENLKDLSFAKDTLISSLLIKKYDPATDTILLKTGDFSYTDDQYSDFLERIRLINDYYACASVIDSVNVIESGENTGSCKDLPAAYIRIEEMSKTADLMAARHFQEILHLEEYDPQHFVRKYHDYFRRSKSYMMTFLQRLDTAGTIIIHPGCSTADILVDHFCRYIRWSMLVNSRNGRIYEDYLSSYFSINIFEDDLSVIRSMIAKMFPDNPSEAWNLWSALVCNNFEKKAKEYISQHMFAEAERLADVEEQFIRFSGYHPQSNDHLAIKTNAGNGIYDSFLGIALMSMQNRKFQMAEYYLAKAQEFRLHNPQYVTSDSLFHAVSSRLIGLKLSECDTMAAHGLYDEAISCYGSMNVAFDSLTTSFFRQELKRKLDFCYFHRYRDAGVYYLDNGNMTDAGKFLHMACNLKIMNHFPADTVLDSLCRVTYPYFLISFLRSGEEMIWTDHLSEAALLADSIGNDASRNGVGQNPELTVALNKFRDKIRRKECYDATDTYEIYVLRGEQNYEMRNFQRGNTLLDSAMLIAHLHPSCHLDTMKLSAQTQKYYYPAVYQKQLKYISNLISVNEYEKAVDLYFENENFFREHRLQEFGITFQPFFDYILSRNLAGLTLEGVHHLTHHHTDYIQALKMLKLLRMAEYPPKETASLQKDLAREMASADFSRDADPSVKIESYIAQDKWFSSFRSAYLYQWNILKNEKAAPENHEE